MEKNKKYLVIWEDGAISVEDELSEFADMDSCVWAELVNREGNEQALYSAMVYLGFKNKDKSEAELDKLVESMSRDEIMETIDGLKEDIELLKTKLRRTK